MKVAFFGIGLMGSRMAKRLRLAGHELTVFNRTPKKTRALRESGVAVAASPAAAVAAAEVVIAMVADAAALRELLQAPEVLSGFAGRTLIQMSTIAPAESEELAVKIHEAGGDYLEAPVLGSTPQAEKGQLIVMVGASPAQFERWRPLLSVFGPDPVLIGPVGKAAALKLAMNQLVASLMAAFSLSYGLTQKLGVRGETFMAVLKRSTVSAPLFETKFKNLATRDFSNPNFPSKHLLKDVNLFLNAAAGTGLDTRALEAVRGLIEAAIAKGHAGSDYSSLFEAVLGGN